MSTSGQRGVVFAAEVLIGGVTGLVVGMLAVPLVATFSPLCLLPVTTGACGPLAQGTFLLLERVGVSLWGVLFVLLSALAAGSLLSYYSTRNEAG